MNRSLLLLFLAASGLAPAASAQLIGDAEQDDHFGYAVATGDFNGDGNDDLAVGAHDEDIFILANIPAAGVVSVIYGTDGAGLDDAGNQYWSQNGVTGTLTAAEPYDGFGFGLASGDFDGDGYDDLAIGVASEELVSGADDHGAVNVIYGSAAGLTNAGYQTWSQEPLLVAGDAQEGELFGWALAAGDFDGDGYDDLAIGVPIDNILGGAATAGAVNVLYGSAGVGLSTDRNTLWHQDRAGVLSIAQSDERFGYALVTGDFNSDGYADLAVGVPGDRLTAGGAGVGSAHVIYGSATGLTDAGDQLWHQDSPGIGDVAEYADYFGAALASGDFDNDDFDDLAVGALYEDYGALADVGQFHVLYGAGAGLTAAGSLHLPAVPGAQADYRLGAALAAGDFDGDAYEDLAVGGPGRDFGAVADGGLAAVLFGSAGGVLTSGYQVWHQNVAGIPEVVEAGDSFGNALAAGDFDSDHLADLAIGAFGESVGTALTAGAVHVLYGTASIGLTATGDQLWYQGGSGSLTGDDPDGEPEVAGTAPPAFAGEASALALLPASPNPFPGRTTLRFTLPEAGHVRLTIYDALGREVAVLVDEGQEAGDHAIAFEAGAVPAGAYFVRIEAAGQVLTRGLTVLR
jgi:hypothetical protein